MRVVLSRILAVLIAGLAAIERLTPATLPRVVKFNEHPFAKRGYGKVLAGGSGGSVLTRFFAPLAYAALALVVVAGGVLLTSYLTGSDAGAVMHASGLAAAMELRRERRQLAERSRELLERAAEEKRDLNSEEQTEFDRIHEKTEELRTRIERWERQEELERGMGEREGRQTRGQGASGEGEQSDEERQKLERDAYVAYLRDGATGLSEEHRNVLRRTSDADLGTMARHARALAGSVGNLGGILIPDGPMQGLEKALKDFGGINQSGAEILTTTTGEDLPYPTTDGTSEKGRRIAENKPAVESDMTFSGVVLGAHIYTSDIIKIPFGLLEDSAIDLVGVVNDRLAERLGRITNEEDTIGTGASMPQGVVTAASVGKTGANGQTTSITYDDLVDLEHSVNAAYRRDPSCGWMFADLTLRSIKKLTDSEGRPLWLPDVAQRAPDRILGYRFTINDDVPVMAANAKSVLFGAFRKFKVRNVRQLMLMRLVERYAENGQVAFLAFMRHDARLVDAGAGPIKAYRNAGS